MKQLTFDLVKAARDEAMVAVDDAAHEEWKEEAFHAVIRTCKALPEFITDRIWDVGELESTREDRALGPVILRAARAGYCTKTDRYQPSLRSHLSPKAVWRSNLYEEQRSEDLSVELRPLPVSGDGRA